MGTRFITLRRRSQKIFDQVENLEVWKRISIPHEKRKYPSPTVREPTAEPRSYEGRLRLIVVRGNGCEKPAFLIAKAFEIPVELLLGNTPGSGGSKTVLLRRRGFSLQRHIIADPD